MNALPRTKCTPAREDATRRAALSRQRRRECREFSPALFDLANELERAAAACRVIAYQEPLDRVLSFLEHETSRSHGFTRSAALYARYMTHCAACGAPSEYSPVTFGKKLQALGLRSRKSNGVKVWVGVELKAAMSSAPAPQSDPEKSGMVRRDGGLLAASVAAVTAALAGMDRRNLCAPSLPQALHHP